MYYEGKGGPPDYTEAAAYFRKAARGGIASAQHNLGIMYEHGWGGEQSAGEAAKWFRKAAEKGLAESQFRIGLMYADGNGVDRNYVLAYMWLSLAAEQGEENAIASRDLLTGKMAAGEVSRAQELTREWKKSHD